MKLLLVLFTFSKVFSMLQLNVNFTKDLTLLFQLPKLIRINSGCDDAMKSMTGYGRSEMFVEGYSISVEMKSVNHRYSDISIRLPRNLQSGEESLRKFIQGKLHRGKIDVFISLLKIEGSKKNVSIDWGLAEEYVRSLKKFQEKFHLQGELKVSDFLHIHDLFVIEEIDEDIEGILDHVMLGVQQATFHLLEMREREGQSLKNDLIKRVRTIQDGLKNLEGFIKDSKLQYASKLEERLKELLRNRAEMDEHLFLNEIAYMAEKTDVSEEITRLDSHLQQLILSFELDEPMGRKLDFLVQEMNREVNTIGSKAQDLRISQLVVEFKSTIEKIREQVQNIE